MLEIKIPMRPVAKARPRFANGRCYTDEKTKRAEDAIAWAVKAEMIKHGIPMYETALSMYVEFGFAFPKSLSKQERELVKNGKFHHIKRPDLDNVCKTVMDSLNGLAYRDDSLIAHLEAFKVYGESDHIIIRLEEI